MALKLRPVSCESAVHQGGRLTPVSISRNSHFIMPGLFPFPLHIPFREGLSFRDWERVATAGKEK